ncbi:MAG: type I-E CRISPR-associated protein Cse1/CasA [Gemmatimonas sp.]
MTLDLANASWIAWQRRSGAVEWGPVSLLTDQHDGPDPVIGISAARPDIEAALLEFLIGLLSWILKPADESDWRKYWHNPPTPHELQQAISALGPIFLLDNGDGPAFLQDFSPLDLASQEVLPIDRLAIDSPGEQGIEHNKTLFVKPGRFKSVSRAVAAQLILAMQTYAPEGGRGNRASMRGGGPLTTIVDPRREGNGYGPDQQPLWHVLWINVETVDDLHSRAPREANVQQFQTETILPWVACTVSSVGNRALRPISAHPLQAYFGMPRRLRLEYGSAGTCDVSGAHDERLVIGFRQRNYGVKYEQWRHPLSPYYFDKTEWRAVHPQQSGLTWRDWPGYSVPSNTSDHEIAATVVRAIRRLQNLEQYGAYRIHAFGYDTASAKIRAWVSAIRPAFVLADQSHYEHLADLSKNLVEATSIMAFVVTASIKRVWFESDDIKGELNVPRQQLWDRTEAAFFKTIQSAIDNGFTPEARSNALRSFLTPLKDAAREIFDEACGVSSLPIDSLSRYAGAELSLRSTFAGAGKMGEKLYEVLTLKRAERKDKNTNAKQISRRNVAT